MKASKVFMGTMPFVLLKIALGVAEILLALAALWAMISVGNAVGGYKGGFIAACIWAASCKAGSSLISRIVGYLIKAGHVAVVAEACSRGGVPENQIAYGFQKVKKRFAAAGAFFLVDSLISGAVSQIQRAVGRIGGLLGFIPGMDKITGILQKFIGIFLSYIDECCLGWCFLHEEESAFKAACDGVVIYFQNVKHLLKSAAVTTVTVIIGTAVLGGISFALTSVMGLAGSIYTFVFLAAALMLTWVLKTALIDSWMMVKMMCSYMEVAPATEITYDLYEKLCGLSTSFKKLFKKAQKETAQPAA